MVIVDSVCESVGSIMQCIDAMMSGFTRLVESTGVLAEVFTGLSTLKP